MAIKKGKFIVGSIGGVVHKVLNGVQTMQSAPGKGGVKQTEATKKIAEIFGKASVLAKSIRHNLGPIFRGDYDQSMVYRLTTAVAAIVRQSYQKETSSYSFNTDSFDSLVGFDLNASSPLKNSLWLSPKSSFLDGMLKVIIPKAILNEELKFPAHATNCIIKVSFCLFNLEGGYEYLMPTHKELVINSAQGVLEQQEFDFQVPEGCLCIVGIVLYFYKMNGKIAVTVNNKAFSPSAICATYHNPGTFAPERLVNWKCNYKGALK